MHFTKHEGWHNAARNPRTLPFFPAGKPAPRGRFAEKKERARVRRCASSQGFGCRPAAMTVSPSQGIGPAAAKETLRACGIQLRCNVADKRWQRQAPRHS